MASRSAIDGPSGVVISVAYFGDAGEGRDALQPLLDVGPETDGVRPMYYAELQEMFARMPFGAAQLLVRTLPA